MLVAERLGGRLQIYTIQVRILSNTPRIYMYNVTLKNGFVLNASPTLADAMAYAKDYGEFVIIKGPDMEIAGVFGVAAPPEDYEWKKDYSLGSRKSKKVWIHNETKTDR